MSWIGGLLGNWLGRWFGPLVQDTEPEEFSAESRLVALRIERATPRPSAESRVVAFALELSRESIEVECSSAGIAAESKLVQESI